MISETTAWPNLACWDGLESDLANTAVDSAPLFQALSEALVTLQHGDLPRWQRALEALPHGLQSWDGAPAAPCLGAPAPDPTALREALMGLHPWRKGPLRLAGVHIDTEWRSDMKWSRLKPHIDWAQQTVLDVGCGNGYFGWRMLAAGARCVVGIDPTMLFLMQWLAQRHFSGLAPNYVLPLRDTDLPATLTGFDRVCSLGVLYHRRDPLDHLGRLRRCLREGGVLVLETLVVEGDESLQPPGRYARMRNVYEVPSLARLKAQLHAAGFQAIQVADVTWTTREEQRRTDWMQFESLAQCLDPENPAQTVEGHPAPLRALVLAQAS